MTTEITTTTSDLIIEKRDDGWRYLVMNGQELRWQPSDPMSKLQEFFRPLGYAAFISKDEEMDFYWTTTDLKITVETNGGCEVHKLLSRWQTRSHSSSHQYWNLHLVANGLVTVNNRYQNNENGGSKTWTIEVWEVKGGVATLISREDVQARLDAEARKQFAHDQASTLVALGYPRQEAWDIIRAGGPGIALKALEMARIWSQEWGVQPISLGKILEACHDYARQSGECRNDSMPDLDYFLEQSGLTVPKVKYGQMFALVRAAMVVLELGFPVQASV